MGHFLLKNLNINLDLLCFKCYKLLAQKKSLNQKTKYQCHTSIIFPVKFCKIQSHSYLVDAFGFRVLDTMKHAPFCNMLHVLFHQKERSEAQIQLLAFRARIIGPM